MLTEQIPAYSSVNGLIGCVDHLGLRDFLLNGSILSLA